MQVANAFVEKQLLGEPLQEPNCAICAAAIKVYRIKFPNFLPSDLTVAATRYERYICIRLRITKKVYRFTHGHVYIPDINSLLKKNDPFRFPPLPLLPSPPPLLLLGWVELSSTASTTTHHPK